MLKGTIPVALLLLFIALCSGIETEHDLPENDESHWGDMLDAVSGMKSFPVREQRVDSLFDTLNDILRNVPTASPAPTEYPTESPAPSPSPSVIPTGMPSSTPVPTGTPSASPTESPAPSPSPSEIPSESPSASPSESPSVSPSDRPSASPSASPSQSVSPSHSPSDVPSTSPSDSPSSSPSESPSASPSSSPSDVPSVSPSQSPSDIPSSSPSDSPSASPSALPSEFPSASPSDVPSPSPSVSVAPSESPSSSPSVSIAPSASPSMSSAPSVNPSESPTEVPSESPTISSTAMSTILNLLLEHVEELMDGEDEALFIVTTMQFISENTPEDDTVGVYVTSVEVTDQAVVVPARSLQKQQERNLHEGGLSVDLTIDGYVTPKNPPESFSFANAVGVGFTDNYTAYVNMLANTSEFFAPLLETDSGGNNPAGAQREPTDSSGKDSGLSSQGAIGVIVGSVVALTIAAVASVVSIRKRRKNYVDNNAASTSKQSSKRKRVRYTAREVPSSPKVLASISGSNHNGEEVESKLDEVPQVPSPNTLEAGNNVFCNEPDCPNPPVEHCLPSFMPTMALIDLMTDQEDNASGNGVEVPIEDVNEPVNSLIDTPNSETPSELEKPIGIKPKGHKSKRRVNTAIEAEKKDAETIPIENRTPSAASEVLQDLKTMESSVVKEIITNPTNEEGEIKSGGGHTPTHSVFTQVTEEPGVLGAQPLHEGEYVEKTAVEVTHVQRMGLYDVFAPPGPLGIVVDTTQNGPVVHSLKSTSSLKGLVSPGDIIVGLDDMDTRSMTAATLTRLMAKRSHQQERKITLLAGGSSNP